MPTYEYQCRACGHRVDAFQRMSDAPLVDCPQCEKPELKRLVSAAAFQLKGNGWYQTDFKHSGKQDTSKDGGKDGAKDSPLAETPAKEATGAGTAAGCGGGCACH
jgi:putative FmdB family regulatory protein